ncbi:MAG TPA: hypothetical protein ENJ56_01850, partial [Anaerolineae bacterium]|nr:hypothetical protein [Anaerolineae bacterium]
MRKKIILTLLLTILLFVGFRPNVTAETSDAITEAESAEQNELDRAVLAAAEAERRELNRERVDDEPPEIITADPNRRTRATLTVGTNCTYANLQTAVNASLDGDTILVEGKTFSGSSATVNIGNGQAITIIGGYDDSCTTPTATPTTLNATGQGDSVFELYGSNGSVGNFDQVTIRNFVITGGEDDANFGGGIEINVGYEVRIEDSEIAGNTSTFGGGIHINGDAGLRAGDAKLFISSNTVIKGNTATDSGGGIYCFEADVVLTGDASLGDYFIVPIGNTATNEGGGFYGDGGCRFDAYADVKGNDAANGGGVYLTGSSSLFMLFAESAILNNHATTGDGGGVYLSDGSSITQSIGQIRYNTANDDGGGIYATGNGTQLSVRANYGTHCVVGEKCVEVSHNTATVGNGGGIYLNGGATADVAQAYFEYNTSQFGGAIYLSRSAALQTALTVSNVVFARNTVENKYILRYYSTDTANVALRLEGITFAENIDNFGNVVEIGLRGNYTANLLGLIIWGADSQDAYFTETGASVTIDFSLLPAGGAFPPTNQVGVDPLFIDPANDDWHLRPDSPAVNVYFGGGLADDVEGETRPARGSSFFVGAMAWDAGADEATSRVSINGELCSYATIGEAVAAASNGDVLYISGGHYFELLDEVG